MYVNKSITLQQGDNHNWIAHHALDEGDTTMKFRLATFFISIPICLAAVLVDVLLIFVILKYKALKTRINYYILHYCVCNIIFLTAEHVVHLCMDLFFGGYLERNWYCTFIQLENYFFDMCIIFMVGYVLDEYMPMTASDYYLYMYKNGYKYLIGSVYVIHFILAFIVTNVCFSNTEDIKFHSSFIFVSIVYVVCLAVTMKIKIDCRKAYFRNNKNLVQALTITQFTILYFLPVIFYYNVLSIVEQIITEHNFEILGTLAFIPEYIAYAATFVLAYKLYTLNKFYRLAISKIFCKSKSDLDFSRLDIVPQADIDKK